MRFKVYRTETYSGSQHEIVRIVPQSGFGLNHCGWYLIRADKVKEYELLEEGSGIFRPEFGKEIQKRLEPPSSSSVEEWLFKLWMEEQD
jgi:hypothetical protein